MASDDEFAALASGLNEDSKAARRKKPKADEPAPELSAAVADSPGPDATTEGNPEAEAETNDGEQAADKPSATADRIGVIAEEAVPMAANTLAGDMLERFLDLYKTRVKPWHATPEDEQKQIVAALRSAIRDMMKEVVWIVREASDGGFEAKLEKYVDAGGLKIALSAESTLDNVVACHNSQGLFVTVRRVDPNPFMGERREPETMPDQPGMAFDADKGDAKPPTEADPFTPPADDSDLAGEGD